MYILIKPIEGNKTLIEPIHAVYTEVLNYIHNELNCEVVSSEPYAYTITTGYAQSLGSQENLSVGNIEIKLTDEQDIKGIVESLHRRFGAEIINSGEKYLISDNPNDYYNF